MDNATCEQKAFKTHKTNFTNDMMTMTLPSKPRPAGAFSRIQCFARNMPVKRDYDCCLRRMKEVQTKVKTVNGCSPKSLLRLLTQPSVSVAFHLVRHGAAAHANIAPQLRQACLIMGRSHRARALASWLKTSFRETIVLRPQAQ